MAIERISLLGVPVDICSPDKLENQILELLAKPGTKQIIFLSIWDLLKARRKKSVFAETVRNADLVIPISKSILKGAKFLKRNIPHRYNPFECVIQILSILDAHFKTLYLFGSNKKTLQQIYPPVDKFKDSQLGQFIQQIKSIKSKLEKVK